MKSITDRYLSNPCRRYDWCHIRFNYQKPGKILQPSRIFKKNSFSNRYRKILACIVRVQLYIVHHQSPGELHRGSPQKRQNLWQQASPYIHTGYLPHSPKKFESAGLPCSWIPFALAETAPSWMLAAPAPCGWDPASKKT